MGLTFKLHINTACMPPSYADVRAELARLLRQVAAEVERDDPTMSLFQPNRIVDSAGHDCGRFFVKKELD